jgi:hypothetical protein
MNRAEKYFGAVLGLFAAAWLVGYAAGCATGPAETLTNDVPNLSQVEPGVWRSGQPKTLAGWRYLHDVLHCTKDIKLNTGDEASDRDAIKAGLKLFYFPIDTLEQLELGPDEKAMSKALALIGPGTIIHCQHGEDRTGYLVGRYRLIEGTNAAAAWMEMTNHNFHPALKGLTRSFEQHAQPR